LKKTQLSFLPGIIWLIVITYLLLLPGSAFPQETWLSRLWFDKWVHIGLFAILIFLWCRAFTLFKNENKTLKKIFLSIAFIALAYGVGMEFIQKYYVINRSFEGGDIVADGIGCFTGLIFSWKRYIKK
jgi:hypothetical protein